jgi:endoglucanase
MKRLLILFGRSCSVSEFLKKTIFLLFLSGTSMVFATVDLPERFRQNAKLGKGINIGNALEAPVEGEWGVIIEERFFKLISDKGFNSIRIPINWSTSNRTDVSPPYKISDALFSRIDWVIENALKNRLSVVICMHHYAELYANPEQHKPRFLAIWDQISKRYKNESDSLYFELLNEPHDNIDATVWNGLFAEVLATVRNDNPTRSVIVGPANYNDLYKLDELVLPADTNLILTVHDYLPFQFTHQGAEWVAGSNAWLGNTWDNTEGERKQLYDGLALVKSYSDLHHLPVYIGEFGAYSKADSYSRCQWTNFMARTMEEFGFSWAYWEFCWGFGVYNDTTKTWRDDLTEALMNDTIYPVVQPVLGTNLLAGDFSSGLSPWVLSVSFMASAHVEFVNQKCHVVISALGTDPYNIQLTRPGLKFEKGKNYMVSFTAHSAEKKVITAYTAKNSNPWTNFSDYNSFVVTDIPQSFRFSFLMTGDTDSNCRFSLDIGSTLSDFFLYNVEIREIVFGVAEVRVESEGNITLIGNGTSLQLFARVYPLKAMNKSVSWSVENGTGIASISSDGLLTADSEGFVTVIARSRQNTDIQGSLQINILRQGSGTNEQSATKAIIYPNPVSGDYLYIQNGSAQQNEENEVTVFSLNGNALFKGSFGPGLIKMPVHGFPDGIYILKIRNSIGESLQRFIITCYK